MSQPIRNLNLGCKNHKGAWSQPMRNEFPLIGYCVALYMLYVNVCISSTLTSKVVCLCAHSGGLEVSGTQGRGWIKSSLALCLSLRLSQHFWFILGTSDQRLVFSVMSAACVGAESSPPSTHRKVKGSDDQGAAALTPSLIHNQRCLPSWLAI